MGVGAAPVCDLSGNWTTGWAHSHTGGPGPAAPALQSQTVVVRKAVTPYGTPHAQYVVDYRESLALHPDMRTCLGNEQRARLHRTIGGQHVLRTEARTLSAPSFSCACARGSNKLLAHPQTPTTVI